MTVRGLRTLVSDARGRAARSKRIDLVLIVWAIVTQEEGYASLRAATCQTETVTIKEHIAEIRAMLNSVGAATVYHDDKSEAHDRQGARRIRTGEQQSKTWDPTFLA